MLDLLKRDENGIRLFLFSFLILYLELALIRHTSAEVLYLGYFSNFISLSFPLREMTQLYGRSSE